MWMKMMIFVKLAYVKLIFFQSIITDADENSDLRQTIEGVEHLKI